MCGIVGAVAERPVNKILVEGLKRLEYRGYDSAGVALLKGTELNTVKAVGKVANLKRHLTMQQLMALQVSHIRVGQLMVV